MESYRVEKENERFRLRDMEFIPFPVEPFAVGTHSHIHDAIELLYVTKGDFDVWCDNRTAYVKAGDILLFRSNAIHRTVARDQSENFYWVLKISPRLIINFLPKDKITDSLLRLSVNRDDDKFHWSADELSESEMRYGFEKLANEYLNQSSTSEFAMRIAAAQVVLGVLRGETDRVAESSPLSELMYKAVVYINNNYAEDISAESVSEHFGLSYSYFSRSFKRVIGSSFRAYLNNVRINHAEQLIMNTSKSITEISELCGFENLSYFISVYRSLKGVTPLQSKRNRV